MKRIVSAMMALVMLFSSVNAFAADLNKLTTESMLAGFLKNIVNLIDSPELSMEYTEGESALSGGLVWDEDGIPVLYGERTYDGETFGVDVFADGIVVLTPEGRRGMEWESILNILLEETGLEGILNLSDEDAEVLKDIFKDIAGGISEQAFSVENTETNLGTLLASEMHVSVDVYALAKDLDSAVSRALVKHRQKLDKILKSWGKALSKAFEDLPENINTSDLINLWKDLELSSAPLEGVGVQIRFVYAGSFADPWEFSLEIAGAIFEAQYDGEAFRFCLNAGDGVVYEFDSKDAEYILEMFGLLSGYITADAFSYTDETKSGMRRIALHIDEVRLQKQLLAGLMQTIASRKDRIDDILDKYRPWIKAFYPKAALATADTLLMSLSVRSLNARYLTVQEMLFGIRGAPNGGIRFELSYPVEEIACGVPALNEGEESLAEGAAAEAVVYESASAKTGSVGILLGIGRMSVSLHADESSLEIKSEDLYGRNRVFHAYTDDEGKSVVCNYTCTYADPTIPSRSVSMTADRENIHIYSGAGDIDINIGIGETEALINARIDDDTYTGNLAWTKETLKFFLTDGEDIVDAALHVKENSVSLSVNAGRTALSAAAQWAEDSFALDINVPSFVFEADVTADSDGVEISWKNKGNYTFTTREGTVALTEEGFRLRNYVMNSKYNQVRELTAGASWLEENPALDILISSGSVLNMQDDFSLTYRPGNLMLIRGGQVIHINDMTSEGSLNRNTTRISVYNAINYAVHNSGEKSAPVDWFLNYIDLTTAVSGGKYHMTVSDGNAVLAELIVDFNPDSAKPVYEDREVLWLTPELFRLMYMPENQDLGSSEMPIPVYAPEDLTAQPEMAAEIVEASVETETLVPATESPAA